MKITELEISKIHQVENSRSNYKDSELHELMTTLKKDGLLQPIGVRLLSKDKYEVVWGNRRLMAAKKLGWDTIHARVVTDLDTENERDMINLIENIKRSDINSFDEGKIYSKFVTRDSLNYAEIAIRLGITEKRVRDAIKVFYELPEEYRAKVTPTAGTKRSNGKISAAQASHALQLAKEMRMTAVQKKALLEQVINNKLSNEKVRLVAKAMTHGFKVEEAMDNLDDVGTVRLNLVLAKKDIARLEEKYKKSVRAILVEWIDQMPGLTLKKQLMTERYHPASARA